MAYLRLRFPDVDEAVLEETIDWEIKHHSSPKICDVIVYPEPGECDLKRMSLGHFISENVANTIAPCGTIFKSDPENIPPSVRYNDSCRKDRSKFKKLMFDCSERGDTFGENLNNGKQNLKKIKNNSIIGGHGFEGCPFYDKESFNAITSLGRNGVILSYSLAEQLLSNNFYWSDEEKVIGYVISTAQGAVDHDRKDQILSAVERHSLSVPDADTVAKRLLSSAKYYMSKERRKKLYQKLVEMFQAMPDWQKCYVFYRRNLINLFSSNSDLFRDFFARIQRIDTDLKARPDYQALLEQVSSQDALKLPEDISMMLAIIYNHVLDYKAVNKELVKKHPEVAKEFALIGKAVQEILNEYEDIFEAFMYTGESVPRVMENKYIIRKAVAVSDTDSILFTMKTIVSWYLKDKFEINQAGINLSAYLVFIFSKILNIANRDLAIAKGAVGEAADRISLKSEFFYAVFVKTDLGKHYFTKYLSKEGRVAKSPKIDIKGVELQSSTLPKVSRDFAKTVMSYIIDQVYEHGKVSEDDLIAMCVDYEQTILTSLKSGDLSYYANVSIKEEEQYAQPDRSIYFNYKFWHEVFEEDFGPINIPGKYPVVPFKEKIAKDPMYLEWLRKNYPNIHGRYLKFLESIPANKRITRIPLPGELTKVPDVLIPCVNLRAIVYKNLAPAQLALRQLGISCGKQKQMPLFLDIYGSITDPSLSFEAA